MPRQTPTKQRESLLLRLGSSDGIYVASQAQQRSMIYEQLISINYTTGWWFGTWCLWLSIQLGMEKSSQLTNSYFSEELKTPTRLSLNMKKEETVWNFRTSKSWEHKKEIFRFWIKMFLEIFRFLKVLVALSRSSEHPTSTRPKASFSSPKRSWAPHPDLPQIPGEEFHPPGQTAQKTTDGTLAESEHEKTTIWLWHCHDCHGKMEHHFIARLAR